MFDAISRDDSFTYNMPPYGPAGMAGPIGPRGPRDQTNPLFGADIMRSREGAPPAAWQQHGVCGRVLDTETLCGLPATWAAGRCLPQGCWPKEAHVGCLPLRSLSDASLSPHGDAAPRS